MKAPKIFGNWTRESPLRGDFTKKWKFLIFLGPHSHPSAPIDVKFCAAKRTQVPVGPAKFDLNRCNESPLYEVVRTNFSADFCTFRNF